MLYFYCTTTHVAKQNPIYCNGTIELPRRLETSIEFTKISNAIQKSVFDELQKQVPELRLTDVVLTNFNLL